MRGKLYRPAQAVSGARITPAGAGKTYRVYVNLQKEEDHPRRCGENKWRIHKDKVVPGSPPQVRGKQINSFVNVIVLRITPAGAGKTFRSRYIGLRKEDHPRRCGENLSLSIVRRRKQGSPPQVRGKQDNPPTVLSEARITPAGAGKTS